MHVKKLAFQISEEKSIQFNNGSEIIRKYIVKIYAPCFFLLFLSVASMKFKIIFVACIVFLLGGGVLDQPFILQMRIQNSGDLLKANEKQS